MARIRPAPRTATVGTDGTWSITGIDVSALADGELVFTAAATDSTGNSSQTTHTATKDTTAPAVAISSVTNPINAASAGLATASGTGEVGATISLVASDGTNNTAVRTTTVASDGTWSISGIDVSSLADGTITFTVTAADAAGNSTQRSLASTKDTVAPPIDVTNVTSPITIANYHAAEASGTGEVGVPLVLVVSDGTNSTTGYTTVVGQDGTWSITGIDVSELADGTLTFTVTATDTAGNTAQSSLTATKATVVVVAVTDPINADASTNASASGTGQAGATVSLVASDGSNTSSEYSTVVGEDGTWNITGIDVSDLADGTITFTATATDGANNTAQNSRTATKDTVAPAVAILSVTDPINAADIAEVSVHGTGEAGAVITLVASDGDTSTAEYNATVAEDGTWSISGIDVSELADGTLTFTATAADAAGNTAQTSLTANKDTVAPAVAVTNVTSPITIANQKQTSLSGTGEVGATISLVASDGTNSTIPYDTVVAEDGTWSIGDIDLSGLADGTITFTITATDAAGNPAQTTADVTKTTVAVTFISAPINAESATDTTISGTGEVGATIVVVVTDGTNTTGEYTTVIGEEGTWTIAGIDVSDLADGTITYQVTATDADENTAETSRTATKDSIAPNVVILPLANQINAAGAGSVSVSGTGEVGAAISLVVTDGDTSTSEYTTTIGEDGTWTIAGIDVSGLADGTLTFTVTATDAAGNSAQDITTPSKDTEAPAVAVTGLNSPITIAEQHSTTASGTGEIEATISLVVSDGTNSTTEYTTVVAADGTWSISDIDVGGLVDGTLTYTATATDAAGNSAQGSLTTIKQTVAITFVTDPIDADHAASVTISGTGEIGADISVVASDGVTVSGEYTTTVAEDGTWSISGIDVAALADGTLTFTATATNGLSGTAQSSRTAAKDTVAPAVNMTSITDPITIANRQAIEVGGSGEIGAAISLVVSDGANSTTEYTAVVGEDGTWSISDIDVSDLADGTITFTATATDTAGNTAQSSLTATKATVFVASVTDPINSDNAASVTVNGTGQVGAAITLVASDGANSTTENTTVVGQDGTWSISDIDVSELADGTITFTATATDDVENTAQSSLTAVKDTVPPVESLTSTGLADVALADEESWI